MEKESMTPSPKELAAGQKAYERLDAFQRQKPLQSLLFVLIMMGSGIWIAFEKGDLEPALWIALFWSVVSAISIYQFQKQKKRAEKSALLLANLKQTYGDHIYSEIAKAPHSLFYNIFVGRYPPLNRKSVKLP